MQVDILEQENGLLVKVAGSWTMEDRIPSVDRLAEESAAPATAQELRFDATDLGEWDSSLAAFLFDAVRFAEDRDMRVVLDGLPDDVKRLLTLARAAPEREQVEPVARRSMPEWVGEKVLEGFNAFRSFSSFLGEFTIALFRVLLGRERFRWRDFWLSIQSNSSGAFPIVTLISFLVGLIIAFLGAVVLAQFGADYYISYLIGFGMLRQMAALMTGIILTGRTGAAFAAELGTMKVMEELDAFKTLGLSPMSYLVVPRVLAVFLMMPLLTIYSMFIGIMGGLLVAVVMAGLAPSQYFAGLLFPITIIDALLGVFKGFVFGAIIGLSGCMQGMRAGTDAEAVGKAATSAVVMGITLIIVSNALIDWLAALFDI